MTFRWHGAGWALLLAAAAATDRAQAQGPAVATLPALERAALLDNPGLRVLRLTMAAARADVTTAGLRPNPTLAFTGDVFTTKNGAPRLDIDGGSTGASLQLPIELGGKRRARVANAAAAVTVASLQFADSARSVLLTLRQAYTDVQAAREAVRLADVNVAAYQRLVTLNQSRFEAKQISGSELARAQLARDQAELTRDGVMLTLQQAQDQLALVTGRQARILPADTLAVDARTVPPMDTLLAATLERRPDVRAARAQREFAQSNIRLQDANGVITPTINADYSVQQHSPSYGLSGSIPLPTFNRNQGEREKARASLTQSDRGIVLAELKARTELRAAYSEYETRRANLQRFTAPGRDGILARARQITEAAEYAYKAGSVSLLEFLDAQRTFAEITRAYVDAVALYNRSLATLDAASGADAARLVTLATDPEP